MKYSLEAAPSRWPRDKPSAGRGREGAVSPAVGTGGWHQARRAPTALLLLHGLQMLRPGGRLRVPSGKSRRVLQISASSLAGGLATWKTTGISLVWSGLDPVCPPGMSCTCTGVGGGGWALLALARGIWGVITSQDRVTPPLLTSLGEARSWMLPHGHLVLWSPSVPWGLIHLSVGPAPSWSIKDPPLLWVLGPSKIQLGAFMASLGAHQGCSVW